MKTNIRQFLAAALLGVAAAASAQGLNSAYFTEGYAFRHQLNPAFVGDSFYVALPAMGNVNVGLRGNFGLEDALFDNPWYGTRSTKSKATFMHPGIDAATALDGFNTGNNRLSGDISLAILSAGFKAFGGYNTVEINARATFGTVLPYELFRFAKGVGNEHYDIGDIDASAQGFVELAIGHSRQINDRLRLGAKLKFLFGGARADVSLKNVSADLAGDDQWRIHAQGEANMSMKGFAYKSASKEYRDRPGRYDYVNDMDVDGAGLGGFGMAIDLGGIYKLNDDWTFSAALLDLGFIHWSNSVRAVNANEDFTFEGFRDVSASSERGENFDRKTDKYFDQFADFAHLRDQGDTGGRTTGIGATVNLGAQYTLPVYDKVKFGALSSTRIRGKYSWTEGRLSANYTPLRWLDGNVNLAAGSFGWSTGWLLNFHPKGFNFFIGMDHILGKLSADGIPMSSNASVNLGMSVAL